MILSICCPLVVVLVIVLVVGLAILPLIVIVISLSLFFFLFLFCFFLAWLLFLSFHVSVCWDQSQHSVTLSFRRGRSSLLVEGLKILCGAPERSKAWAHKAAIYLRVGGVFMFYLNVQGVRSPEDESVDTLGVVVAIAFFSSLSSAGFYVRFMSGRSFDLRWVIEMHFTTPFLKTCHATHRKSKPLMLDLCPNSPPKNRRRIRERLIGVKVGGLFRGDGCNWLHQDNRPLGSSLLRFVKPSLSTIALTQDAHPRWRL